MLDLNVAWEKQKNILKKYNIEKPELLVPEHNLTEEEIYHQIGIRVKMPNREEGYVKYCPQDFIVEEISKDQKISEIEPNNNSLPKLENEKKFSLFADLVKVSISTLDAVNVLSKALNIPLNRIGYAGIKDAVAITSQKVSLRGVKVEDVTKLDLANIFLKNYYYDKGLIQPGNLLGNRFTLFIRTKKKVENDWLKNNLQNIEKNGFLNFYHVQRFGTPRHISHVLGCMLAQKKYDEALKIFFTSNGLHSIPLIKNIRKEAENNYGKWAEMKKIFLEMPYFFRLEIKVLEFLEKYPYNVVGAFQNIQDQVRMWLYAYASYLFNLKISELQVRGDKFPEKLPLLLSSEKKDQQVYKKWLDEVKIEDLLKNIKPFSQFISSHKQYLTPTKIFPKIIAAAAVDDGVVLSFILSKGAYATTFLSNLFTINMSHPVPGWVSTQEYDTKAILSLGSAEEVIKVLGKYIETRENDYLKI